MITEHKACEKIIKLHDDNAAIRAIPNKRRSTLTSSKRVKDMEAKLSETFVLWPTNVEQLMRNSEDVAFLKSMRTDRHATFGCHDKVLANRVRRRQQRQQSQLLRQLAAQKEFARSSQAVIDCITDSESDSEGNNVDAPCTSKCEDSLPLHLRHPLL